AVLTNCATAACHGGGAGSDRFALHPKADHEAEAYANLVTLHKYQYKPDKGREASMIDRNRPEDSILIQFALAPNLSNNPHPNVEGYKPIFRTLNDAKYKQFVRWIADGLSPLINDYGVPFDDDRGARPAAGGQQPEEGAPPRDAGSGAGPGPAPAGGGTGAPNPAGARQPDPAPQGEAR